MKIRYFNLQFFAEGDGGQNNEPTTQEPGTTEPPKTFTQEELDEIINKRLKRERTSWEKKLEDEKNEASRLAKLTEQQRQEEEYKKKLQALEDREKQLSFNESVNQATKELQSRDLPTFLVEKFIGKDAEETLENINNFEKQYKADLQAAVKQALPSTEPGKGDGTKETTLKTELEAIANDTKLPLSQRVAAKNKLHNLKEE